MRQRRSKLTEAATIKARTRRMVRDMEELLKDKALPESLRRQVEILRDSFRKTWAELEHEAGQERGRKGIASKEADVADKTKTVGGKAYPASDFLVVPDPESPSTWNLQVMRDGKPDPKLMGAAHAALTTGFRGQKYEGPDKAKALKTLKKMYADMDMEMPAEPSESAEKGSESLAEGDYYGDYVYVPSSITSFAQLDAAQEAQEMASDLRMRVNQFTQMMNNIFWQPADAVPDKLGAVQTLFDEFVLVVGDILGGDQGENGSAIAGSAASEAQPAGAEEQFSESYAPTVSIVEAEGDSNPRGPLEMDVQLIQPGWGNARDNHYYPAETLKRCAEVFVGAKMYTTDHKQDEKSERTEVSQIKRIVGFTEAGAPIGRVVVFDPDFAEKCRNRKKAGLLESLECSILADGKARPGYEQGGRKGKLVEDITGVSSVDWVTRAGAGGRALSLAESAEGAQPEETVSTETAAEQEPASEQQPAETQPAAEAADQQPVTIREAEQAQADELPAAETAAAETEPPAAEPVYLGEAEIREALGKTHLPAESVLSLAFAHYESQEALQAAIAAEVKRIKEVSGAGRPFGLGESAASQSKLVRASEVDATIHSINSKFFGR